MAKPGSPQNADTQPYDTIIQQQQEDEADIANIQDDVQDDDTSSANTDKHTGSPKPESDEDSPPVTKDSLKELEPESIRSNVKLRHDINFDPQLQFRPNLDGELGKLKQQEQAQYWRDLTSEVKLWISKPAGIPGFKVLKLLKTVRDILCTLVPQFDARVVQNVFDPDLLWQQLLKGSLDFRSLAVWTQRLIRMHCAPMRDSWADEMCEHFKQGHATQEPVKLVQGFKSLLGLLEHMKLDIANHQIRECRTALIEGTVDFERSHFRKLLDEKLLDKAAARQWYDKAATLFLQPGTSSKEVFFRMLCAQVLPTQIGRDIPATFCFDLDRLRSIRNDIRSAVRFRICLLLFHHLSETFPDKNIRNGVSLSQFKESISALLENVDEDGLRWEQCVDDIALEIFRQATGTWWANSNCFFSQILHAQDLLRKNSQITSGFFESIERVYCAAMTAHVLELAGIKNSNATELPTTQDALDIGRKLAEIGNLHWRIFSDLVYVTDEDVDMITPPMTLTPSIEGGDGCAASELDNDSSANFA